MFKHYKILIFIIIIRKMSTYDSPYITSIPAFIYKLTNLKHL